MKIIFFLYILFLSKYAYAYIDFSFFSVIIQSIVAFIAGAVIAINIYWNQFKNFLKKLFKKDKKK